MYSFGVVENSQSILKVKSQKVKFHRNGPSESKKSIYSERLDKTESPKKNLTAWHLRTKFEGVVGI